MKTRLLKRLRRDYVIKETFDHPGPGWMLHILNKVTKEQIHKGCYTREEIMWMLLRENKLRYLIVRMKYHIKINKRYKNLHTKHLNKKYNIN